MNVARDFSDGDWLASLLIGRIECKRGFFAWASWSNATVKAAQTVFSARPLCKRKFACAGIIGRFANVSTILLVVEPLASVGARVGLAVDIANCD